MTDDRSLFNRRAFLGSIIALPALAAALTGEAAADASKATKSAMHYQSSPNNGMQCSGCRFFNAASDPKSDGTCQVVDGAISPSGYCVAFTAK